MVSLTQLAPEMIGVTFFDSYSCSKKVTPGPAPDLIENLHSDSCLHSEYLKAMYILPHEASFHLAY